LRRPSSYVALDLPLLFPQVCDHADIFEADIGRDVGLLLLLPIFLALASAGGIGGGGIIIPFLLVLSDMPTYYSVPLSNTCVVGIVFVAFVVQATHHHPNPKVGHRPLIDFDLVILLLPMALAGTVLGVLLNRIAPNWLVLVSIMIVISYTSYKTIVKYKQLRRYETSLTEEHAQPQLEAPSTGEHAQPQLEALASTAQANDAPSASTADAHGTYKVCDTDSSKRLRCHMIDLDDLFAAITESDSLPAAATVKPDQSDIICFRGHDIARQELFDRLMAKEKRFPLLEMSITLLELVGLVILNLLRGGTLGDVNCGEGAYWGATMATFFYLLLCALFGVLFVRRKYKAKVLAKYDFVMGDIQYTGRRLYLYPFLCTWRLHWLCRQG
jgi:hypothetical protein